jgi:hypothetical protein
MRGEIGVMCGEYAVVFARVPSTRELRTPEPGPCVVELYQLLSERISTRHSNMSEYWKSTVRETTPCRAHAQAKIIIAKILVQILLHVRERHQIRARAARSDGPPPRQHPAQSQGPAPRTRERKAESSARTSRSCAPKWHRTFSIRSLCRNRPRRQSHVREATRAEGDRR